jgi:[ribosomal protein S18]-alanine N-acetyltransferase
LEGVIQIREMQPGDIDVILPIQQSSFDATPWDRKAYEEMEETLSFNRCIVAMWNAEVAGFASYRVIQDDAELLNIAVSPSRRRRGIGVLLLLGVIDAVKHSGAHRLFLEVRESNSAARKLYSRFGFEQQSRRVGYYSHPPEDALALVLATISGDNALEGPAPVK